MIYNFQDLIRGSDKLKSGVVTTYPKLGTVAFSPPKISQHQSEVITYSILLANLKFHDLALSQDYQAAKDKLAALLEAKAVLEQDVVSITLRDAKLIEDLAQLEKEVSAIYYFTESVYYRVLNLTEKKKVLQERNALVLKYFGSLSGKLAVYQQDINSLLRDYDTTLQDLNALSTTNTRTKFAVSAEFNKLGVLRTKLGSLNLRFLSLETKANVLVKRVAALVAAVTETKNFYTSSSNEHIQAIDSYEDLSSLVFRLEYQFNSITSKLNTIRCNYNQFVNQDYLNQIEGKPYLDMEATIKKLINGFLILSGDNTTVVKDTDGIYTINITWPPYPEREHYTIQLPKPQVIKYELPSNSCPVTCGGCSGKCPVVSCGVTPSSSPSPTTTTTTTANPATTCEFKLTDIEEVDGEEGCDIECYVLGNKIGTFPAKKTKPPTSFKFNVPMGTTKEDFLFKNVKGNCSNRSTFELFFTESLLGTFSIAYDPGDPAGTELFEKDRINCKKTCKIKIKDLNANGIIDDDLDLYIDGVFSVTFPGSVSPTTEYEITVSEGTVLFEFKFKKSNNQDTKKEIEVYSEGIKIYQKVVQCYSNAVPGTVVSRFTVPITCGSKSALSSLYSGVPLLYRVEGIPQFTRESVRIDLSFIFEYPFNHAFAEVYVALTKGKEVLALDSEARLVIQDNPPLFTKIDTSFNKSLVIPLTTDFYSRFNGYQLEIAVGDTSQAQRFGLTGREEARLAGRVYSYLIDYCSSFAQIDRHPIYLTNELSESSLTIEFLAGQPELVYVLLAQDQDKRPFIYSTTTNQFYALLNIADTRDFCLIPRTTLNRCSLTLPLTDLTCRLIYLHEANLSRLIEYITCSQTLYYYDSTSLAQTQNLIDFRRLVQQDYQVFSLSLRLVALCYDSALHVIRVLVELNKEDVGKQVDLYLYTRIDGRLISYDPQNYHFTSDDKLILWDTITLTGEPISLSALPIAKALAVSPTVYLGFGNTEANAYSSSALDLLYNEATNSIDLTNYHAATGSPAFNIQRVHVAKATNPLRFTVDFTNTQTFFSDWGSQSHTLAVYLLLRSKDQIYYQVATPNFIQELGSSWQSLDLANPVVRLPCQDTISFEYVLTPAITARLALGIHEVVLAFGLDNLGLSDILNNLRYTQSNFLSLSHCSTLSGEWMLDNHLEEEDVYLWVDKLTNSTALLNSESKSQLAVWISVSLPAGAHYFLFVEKFNELHALAGDLVFSNHTFVSHTEARPIIPISQLDSDLTCHIYRSGFSDIPALSHLSCLGPPVTIKLRAGLKHSTAFSSEYSIVRDVYRTEMLELSPKYFGNQDFSYHYTDMTDNVGSLIDFELQITNPNLQQLPLFLFPVLTNGVDYYVYQEDEDSDYTIIQLNGGSGSLSTKVSLVKLGENEVNPFRTTLNPNQPRFVLSLSLSLQLYSASHEGLMLGFLLSDVSVHEAIFRNRFLSSGRLLRRPRIIEDKLTLFSLDGTTALPPFKTDEPRRDARLYYEHYTANLNEVSPFLKLSHWYIAMAQCISLETETKWVPYGDVLLAGMFDSVLPLVDLNTSFVQPEKVLQVEINERSLVFTIQYLRNKLVTLHLNSTLSFPVYTNYAGLAKIQVNLQLPLDFSLDLDGTELTGVINQNGIAFNSPRMVWENDQIQQFSTSDFIILGRQTSRIYEFSHPGYCEFYFKANSECYIEVSEDSVSLIQSHAAYLHVGLHVRQRVLLLVKADDLASLEFTYYFTQPRPIVPGLPLIIGHENLDFEARFSQQDFPYQIEVSPILWTSDSSALVVLQSDSHSDEILLDFRHTQVCQSNLYQTACSVKVEVSPLTRIALTQVI